MFGTSMPFDDLLCRCRAHECKLNATPPASLLRVHELLRELYARHTSAPKKRRHIIRFLIHRCHAASLHVRYSAVVHHARNTDQTSVHSHRLIHMPRPTHMPRKKHRYRTPPVGIEDAFDNFTSPLTAALMVLMYWFPEQFAE